jgi:hypothetical protein
MRRTFTEVCKKQIAASQRWTCSSCEKLLDSTYQVDHTVPLWAGGMDSPSNATAMCVACHAVKTQNEAVRRAEVERSRREKKRKEYENRVWKEEESKRIKRTHTDGTEKCEDCQSRYYPLFPHVCREVRKRYESRLTGSGKGVARGGICDPRRCRTRRFKMIDERSVSEKNLFQEFYYLPKEDR